MEEAQAVCDRVAIIDHGVLLTVGRPGYQGAPSTSLLQLGSGVASVSLAPNGAASTATGYVTGDRATFGKGALADLPNIAPGPLNGPASSYGSDAVIVTSAVQLLEVTADARFQPLAMAGDVQHYTAFSAGVARQTKNSADSGSLTMFLSTKLARDAYSGAGLEPS